MIKQQKTIWSVNKQMNKLIYIYTLCYRADVALCTSPLMMSYNNANIDLLDQFFKCSGRVVFELFDWISVLLTGRFVFELCDWFSVMLTCRVWIVTNKRPTTWHVVYLSLVTTCNWNSFFNVRFSSHIMYWYLGAFLQLIFAMGFIVL